jgi:hypothetical protein
MPGGLRFSSFPHAAFRIGLVRWQRGRGPWHGPARNPNAPGVHDAGSFFASRSLARLSMMNLSARCAHLAERFAPMLRYLRSRSFFHFRPRAPPPRQSARRRTERIGRRLPCQNPTRFRTKGMERCEPARSCKDHPPTLASKQEMSPLLPSFQVGERVRLAPSYRCLRFRPGDTGTILAVLPSASTEGPPLYQVRLDGGDATLYPSFYEEELESFL